MGKSKENPMTEVVSCRLTKGELSVLDQAAKAAGMSRTSFVRKRLTQSLGLTADPDSYKLFYVTKPGSPYPVGQKVWEKGGVKYVAEDFMFRGEYNIRFGPEFDEKYADHLKEIKEG
jgi:hypothetical protein